MRHVEVNNLRGWCRHASGLCLNQLQRTFGPEGQNLGHMAAMAGQLAEDLRNTADMLTDVSARLKAAAAEPKQQEKQTDG